MATHELALADGCVVKRFTSWERGEHRREWVVLNTLHRHAPGLVPTPLRADLDACPPSVTMSVVPGVPLSGKITDAQLGALEKALRRLWSVPVGDLPPRRYQPHEVVELVLRDFAARPRPTGVVGEAMTAAVTFLAGHPVVDSAQAVVGHSDPNLANYLWDGSRIRIVDFEDAGRSDLTYELASLVEHVSARDTDWWDFPARFDVDTARLLDGRRLAAVLWLRTLLLVGSSGRDITPASVRRQAERVLFLIGSTRRTG